MVKTSVLDNNSHIHGTHLFRLKEHRSNCFFISAQHGNGLVGHSSGHVHIQSNNEENLHSWRIDFKKVELCCISLAKTSMQLRCNPVPLWKLDMTASKDAWEVFRLIEAGDGSVRIASWNYRNKIVCSCNKGRVYIADKHSS
mmetsp:Transcript_14887/g.21493  ORF Transcript_14887/g.21493 Transcript_14887/m.21493 type:complete len:142 (+) Transcript_14887:327-752(+)